MAHRHTIPDDGWIPAFGTSMGRRRRMLGILHSRHVMLDVDNRIVLNAGLFPDADIVHVAADGDVAPDAGAFADFDIADHLSAGIDVTGSGNPRYDAAVGANHDYGFFMLT